MFIALEAQADTIGPGYWSAMRELEIHL